MKNSKRLPAVAGSFYPGDSDELFEVIHGCFTHPIGPGTFPSSAIPPKKTDRVECLVVPHAGYVYSGPVAAHSYKVASDFFRSRAGKKSVIIVGPNHYGIGSGVSVSPADYWLTPLGEVAVDQELSHALQKKCDLIDMDEIAHSREHSIEVQLPFLQAISGKERDWSFVPIALMLQDMKTAEQLGEAIYEIASDSSASLLLLASSDLTHYESQGDASRKDKLLLGKASKLDTTGFYSTLQRNAITSCGYGAIASVMEVARKLGRSKGELLKYATSGAVTGDNSSVVGYPSMRFV
jgi:AmmeMemoRadiSam system protein B